MQLMNANIEKIIEDELPKIHLNQFDKAGFPYHHHPIAVRNLLPVWASTNMRITALLHDVLEDTDMSAEELKEKFHLEDCVIDSLILLTHKKDQTYEEYIDNIVNSRDLTAISVKVADLVNNMNPARQSLLDEKTKCRMAKKYSLAFIKIKSALNLIKEDISENMKDVGEAISYIKEIVDHFSFEKSIIFQTYQTLNESRGFIIKDFCPRCSLKSSDCEHSLCNMQLIDLILNQEK